MSHARATLIIDAKSMDKYKTLECAITPAWFALYNLLPKLAGDELVYVEIKATIRHNADLEPPR